MSDEDRNEVELERGAAGPRFALEELFRGKGPAEWRTEYAGACDWGPDLGREIVEE